MRKRPNISENQFDKWAEQLKSWIAESVSPFADDTPDLQAERKERASYDLLYFYKTYLPHYFPAEFGEFHHEWQELTELEDETALCAAPREHAKSTFFTFGLPLHDICFAVKWFILIISDTNDQATGFTLPIRLELEDNPRIRHDFGDLIGQVWKQNDFTSSNGVRVLARGRGEKVRGLKNRQHRPDRAIVDDYENDENVENPVLVKKGLRWLKRAVIGSMGAGYNFLMVGNLFHPKSVLSQLIAEKDEDGNLLYVSRVYRAWIDYGHPDQRPLWPAAWPAARLEKKKRQMGTVDFNAEMMNLTGAENSPFQEDQVTYYGRQDLHGIALRTATFCDPSAASGEANDYKAIITVGLDVAEMVFYVLHAWIRHASPGKMFDACYDQHDEYGGASVGIEENMLKDFLHEAIQNYAKDKKRYLPWQAVHHSSNKEARIIGTLAYLFEYGKLRFCKNQSDQDLLVEQLIFILNKNVNDDGPDALEGAVSLLQSGGPAVYGSSEVKTGGRLSTEIMPERRAGEAAERGSLFNRQGVGRMMQNSVIRGRQ